jgi:iron(III) transport system substrate-binding protein
MTSLRLRRSLFGAVLAATGLAGLSAQAAEELNLYSSRHYQTDEALYENFTKQTGIRINRIEGKGDALIERLKSEGANSPADVFLTVDAGRIWRAEEAGLFAVTKSETLDKRIPANLRDPDGQWFGFSTRARVIFYNPKLVAEPPQRYEDLADPKYKDLVCIRSSSNIYNLSLLGSLIENDGEAAAEKWAKGVVANFARDPKGGDTDQIRAVAAGECGISIGNTYYFVRLLKSEKEKDKAVVANVKMVWPNQADRGVHVNVSAGGVLKNAPNKAAAVKFLEYLSSDAAQGYLANGNNEYPVVTGILENPQLQSLGQPKIDTVNVSVYGDNQPLAQKVFDRAGWK